MKKELEEAMREGLAFSRETVLELVATQRVAYRGGASEMEAISLQVLGALGNSEVHLAMVLAVAIDELAKNSVL